VNHRTTAVLALALGLLAPVPALAAFQCPATDATNAADKPNLSREDMAETGGAVSDTLKAAMRHMRTEGLTSGEIVDHLVVAYCGRLPTEATLSDDEKAKQVSRFASRLVAFLYTAPGRNEEDIVVDVSVPTPLYQRLQKAAKKAGVSEDAWVNQAITSRLASPD